MVVVEKLAVVRCVSRGWKTALPAVLVASDAMVFGLVCDEEKR